MTVTAPRTLLASIDPRQWAAAKPRRSGGLVLPFPMARSRLRDTAGLPGSLGRLGDLEVRLARTGREIKAAQRLRYRVFYDEMSALPDAVTLLLRRDRDAFDRICDHLLVLDHAAGPAGKPKVVGTYRLLRQEVAERHDGFYTEGEFEIAGLVRAHPGRRFLELGRSCVLAPYRNKKTVELLWQGIWAYVLHHRVDVMFGCASLEGTEPSRLALPLAFLSQHAGAPAEFTARALPGRYVSMDRLAKQAIDVKAALQALPPLLKGYLRLGATFGDGAVIDRQFGTTDVLVILPVEKISPRYVGYFGEAADRFAA